MNENEDLSLFMQLLKSDRTDLGQYPDLIYWRKKWKRFSKRYDKYAQKSAASGATLPPSLQGKVVKLDLFEAELMASLPVSLVDLILAPRCLCGGHSDDDEQRRLVKC